MSATTVSTAAAIIAHVTVRIVLLPVGRGVSRPVSAARSLSLLYCAPDDPSALTEEEKLIKPDYLLEASQANGMVTKSQKMNALAILMMERPIRMAYGMPIEEINEVIARFAAEVNYPVSFDDGMNLPISERVKRVYTARKERGEIADFWQVQLALLTEVDYLISKNVDVFFRNLTEDQYASLIKQFKTVIKAVRTLAEYDPEVKQAWDAFNAGGEIVKPSLSEETMEYGKNFFKEMVDVHAARRANLLK